MSGKTMAERERGREKRSIETLYRLHTYVDRQALA